MNHLEPDRAESALDRRAALGRISLGLAGGAVAATNAPAAQPPAGGPGPRRARLNHSVCSAAAGSSRIARRAGMALASKARPQIARPLRWRGAARQNFCQNSAGTAVTCT